MVTTEKNITNGTENEITTVIITVNKTTIDNQIGTKNFNDGMVTWSLLRTLVQELRMRSQLTPGVME
jgi:hypothetical protein